MNPHAFATGTTFPVHSVEPAAQALWKHFQGSAAIPADCFLGSEAYCHSTPETLRIGSRTVLRGIIRCETPGQVEIGDDVYVGDGVIVYSRNSIRIGARTMIAHGVQIFDNDAHPANAAERFDDYRRLLEGRERIALIPSAPVVLGEDCWLGMNAIILKGVHIGARSIVAAGAVVSKDVPPDTVVAGNPALCLPSKI